MSLPPPFLSLKDQTIMSTNYINQGMTTDDPRDAFDFISW